MTKIPGRYTTAEAAASLGIKPGTFRVYVHRGEAPKPVEWLDGRTPLWDIEDIEKMKKEGRRAASKEQ